MEVEKRVYKIIKRNFRAIMGKIQVITEKLIKNQALKSITW